ncbi:MAG: family 78 glycoside hydrolase catalytic domain [Terracoccus sp.]
MPSPLRPVYLTTERETEPLAVGDAQPLFGWVVTGDGHNRSQSAYQVRVQADPLRIRADAAPDGADILDDTGWVDGPEQVDVPYDGGPLAAATRYGWQVRVRDETDTEGPWSPVAWFETAPVSTGHFDATWIGTAEPAAALPSLDVASPLVPLQRIWSPAGPSAPLDAPPAGERVWLRTSFEVPGGRPVLSAALVAAGAASVRTWLNGREIAADGTDPQALRHALRPGTNVLAIAATSEPGETPGVVARLEVLAQGAAAISISTDDRWQAWTGTEEPLEGWQMMLDLAASGVDAWRLAESHGHHGDPPRGRETLTHRPSPLLRREFEISRPVRRARLTVTALGLHDVAINGSPVGGDRLAPGWTDYHQRLPYQVLDVTDLLHEGAIAMSAVLADGWWSGNICWFGTEHYGRQPLLLARLEVWHDDGSSTVVVTDEQWKVGQGGIRYADLQNGEVVDARLEPHGWREPGFDDSAWARATPHHPRHGPLEPQIGPPVLVQQQLVARSVTNRPGGSSVVDFGQNLVGVVRLRVRGARGSRIMMRHAEALQDDGVLYTENLRSARCTDEYVLSGDDAGEVFEPRFTVHGFRYCEVIGLPVALDPDDVTALVLHADMPRTGHLTCSDPQLQRLHENIVWGQRGNFLSVPTDCPQRDERLGWTGDAQVFASTAAYLYDVRSFMRKWLRDLRDATVDGCVPHVAPDVLSPQSPVRQGGAAGWGDAAVILPWELLLAYGDERACREMLPTVADWLRFLAEHSDRLVRPDEGFGDWLAPTHTPKDLVATAFYARAADLAARLAHRLDDPRATEWRELHRRVRSAFRRRFVSGGARVLSGSQTAYVLALHFELLDADERERGALRLVEAVRARNWHLSTGFLGTPYLLEVLSRNGHDDVAYRLMMQETYPSWLYPIVHGGATTVWERWDSWSDSRGFADPGMTSFNHYAYGAVGAWMHATIGGIAPLAEGYRRVRVAPRPGGGIDWAAGLLRTPYGEIRTRWSNGPQGLELDVEVPVGVTAVVELPRGRYTGARTTLDDTEPNRQIEVGSGTYRFRPAPD